MGRLGFNLVREKEAASKGADVAQLEAGQLPDQRQNESNEGVELAELLVTIELRNRTIKNLRLLSAFLTIVIICLCTSYLVLTQSKLDDYQEAAKGELAEDRFSEVQAFQRDYDAVQADQERRCSIQLSALQEAQERTRLELERQSSLCHVENQDLVKKYEELQAHQEQLIANWTGLEAELKDQLAKNLDERNDLLGKVQELTAKAQNCRKQQQQQTATTTTAKPSPPRSSSSSSSSAGILGAEQLKKFNDLVKDIETGEAIFNFKEFMRKSDEIFRLR